jgi:hypothetical protein
MNGRAARAMAAVFAVAMLLSLVAGCSVFHRDATETPENKALTVERQAKIQKHKDQ